MELRVYYEDTDLGGIVYHSRYLNFCERARSELFFKRGEKPVWRGYHFIVRHIEATYHLPATLGDLLTVETELKEVRGARLLLYQRVRRGEELLFEMEITLVCLRGDRPARVPDHFLQVLG
ncbi:MAG: YbgC/FadM family acyl-CoA thioesterase [Epsilonproteobacteria bacterium]|nr:acyl-CoA thioester hydrolase [Campylobacterota bacterium]NPA56182.1 YbgC/FadM family acyl-CoA thioesterase [Campylobacterota bacterium]